jgi:hypothetical protein
MITRFDCKCIRVDCLKCEGNRLIERAVAEERRSLQAEFNSRILFGVMTVLNPEAAVPSMEIRMERMEGGWETIGQINVDEWIKRRDRYLRSIGRIEAEPVSELAGLS